MKCGLTDLTRAYFAGPFVWLWRAYRDYVLRYVPAFSLGYVTGCLFLAALMTSATILQGTLNIIRAEAHRIAKAP